MKYKDYRIVDGKPRWIIVDEDREIVNRSPSKEELKCLEKFPEKIVRGGSRKYTDEDLLNKIRRFKKKYGRPPTQGDFTNNPGYPSFMTYCNHFGSWSNTLKFVGLDIESMVKNGIVKTTAQKARLAEIIVRDHFKHHPIDLAKENYNSSCDGICPNGKTYDVKSSKFENTRWNFHTNNKYKEEIEIYYLLAFNEDWTKLEYAWRIPGEIAEKDFFKVGLNPSCKFDIEDMEEYDITDKLRDIFRKYESKYAIHACMESEILD